MKGSPDFFPGFDFGNNDTNNLEFDPHTDFAQFLEEARRYSNNMKVLEGENGKKLPEQLNQEKKQCKKKSWKLTALFSLWKKTEKKTHQCSKQASRDLHPWKPSHPTHVHVSGPVKGTGAGAAVNSKQHRRPASGPLTGLFDSKRKEETSEIPYVSLHKLTKPRYNAKVYGPVYLVS